MLSKFSTYRELTVSLLAGLWEIEIILVLIRISYFVYTCNLFFIRGVLEHKKSNLSFFWSFRFNPRQGPSPPPPPNQPIFHFSLRAIKYSFLIAQQTFFIFLTYQYSWLFSSNNYRCYFRNGQCLKPRYSPIQISNKRKAKPREKHQKNMGKFSIGMSIWSLTITGQLSCGNIILQIFKLLNWIERLNPSLYLLILQTLNFKP